jgi:putative ABC transport system ATP-binding protein
VRAVEDVSAEIAHGSSVAITGPSGCGKSTLLGLIGGLDVPDAGTVRLGGHPLSELGERERTELRHDELGFVFQSDNLFPFLTAAENVRIQLALGGRDDGADRAVSLLTQLGLGDELDKLPDQLSGGQRQRVAVARALVHEPRVVLADEPTGSLDHENAVTILDLLLRFQRERGATLVMVTHDLGVAAALDRTLAMRDGRLV